MAIDYAARAKYAQQQREKTLASAMRGSVVEALQSASKGEPANEEVLKLVVKREDEPKVIENLSKIGQALAMIYNVIKRPIVLPKIFDVKGQVEVTKQAPVEIKNFNEMKKYFESLERSFNNMTLAVQAMPQPQIKLPKFEIPTQIKADNPELTDLLEKLNEKLDSLQPTETKFPSEIRVSNFPQQYIPTPVTHFSLNPLQGLVKTTSTTVGQTLTKLPGYGQLFNRRAIQIYNNSANTIYIGGSDVTTANGIPVPASSYSNIIDAGYNMIVYGIASTNGNDIRVLEVADTSVGGVAIQE